jgi:hypothetical protein
MQLKLSFLEGMHAVNARSLQSSARDEKGGGGVHGRNLDLGVAFCSIITPTHSHTVHIRQYCVVHSRKSAARQLPPQRRQ